MVACEKKKLADWLIRASDNLLKNGNWVYLFVHCLTHLPHQQII